MNAVINTKKKLRKYYKKIKSTLGYLYEYINLLNSKNKGRIFLNKTQRNNKNKNKIL